MGGGAGTDERISLGDVEKELKEIFLPGSAVSGIRGQVRAGQLDNPLERRAAYGTAFFVEGVRLAIYAGIVGACVYQIVN